MGTERCSHSRLRSLSFIYFFYQPLTFYVPLRFKHWRFLCLYVWCLDVLMPWRFKVDLLSFVCGSFFLFVCLGTPIYFQIHISTTSPSHLILHFTKINMLEHTLNNTILIGIQEIFVYDPLPPGNIRNLSRKKIVLTLGTLLESSAG